MHLKKYLQDNQLTQMSFIKKIENEKGIRIPQGTLAKWISGVRIPRKREMIVIMEITNKKVQPNDFYGV
jgi:hypothetical protein